jgi:hypothetical protein
VSLLLTRLACPACGEAVKGEPYDVAFMCPACGCGAEAKDGRLERLEAAALAPPRLGKPDRWKPGWLIEAQVEVRARQTQSSGGFRPGGPRIRLGVPGIGDLQGLPEEILIRLAQRAGAPQEALRQIFGKGASESSTAWKVQIDPDSEGRAVRGAVRLFIFPSFDLPLADLSRLAGAYDRAFGPGGAEPPLSDPPRQPVTGGTLPHADALTLAAHLVIGREAAQPDDLASIDLSLRPARHRFVALPFMMAGSKLRCAVTGVEIPAD